MADLKLWGDRELSRLKRDMDTLFESFFQDFGVASSRRAPDVQFREEADHMVVTARLPGMDPDDLLVEVGERILRLAGRRVDELDGLRRTHTVRRELELPCPTRPEDAEASWDDGVLEIRLPKCKRTGPRRIPIKRT